MLIAKEKRSEINNFTTPLSFFDLQDYFIVSFKRAAKRQLALIIIS